MNASPQRIDDILGNACKHCAHAEIVWLMRAKYRWLAGNVDGARQVLLKAFKTNENAEAIWLAAVKLEKENDQPLKARALLEQARQQAGTSRVWMKSAMLERELGNRDKERALLQQALDGGQGEENPKLWMMYGQNALATGQGNPRAIYQKALSQCPHSIPLWIEAAQCEARFSIAKARSLLERALHKNPGCDRLWLEAVRVEERAGHPDVAQSLLANAMQQCPKSGILWAHSIATQPRVKQKSRAVDALKVCDDNPHVLLSVAKVFVQERKYQKARRWFERALGLDPDLGDIWVHYLDCLKKQQAPKEEINGLIERCVEQAPRHGVLWVQPRIQRQGTKEGLKELGVSEILLECQNHLNESQNEFNG
eukprot:CAMPEP_0201549092 /NCGR_PEP_ID=MMETSP0173_2-20130828/5574_1 /ASSEMBLY_ACC=CAM_ASM_000268 /TAXON_ID=218659 /ORGANISM="Vexillifera sp., Strain DIVA3 564/2" /LENGTH=367 /DNA_ID=CAMNT_0047958649 /DNA_START=167 /DNA_END=1267 /DNA_ORIENTATION=+